MAVLNLSTVQPDQSEILAQLQAYLQTTDAWRGNWDGSVGQTLLQMISSVGALDQAKIRRARQDSIPETAVSDRALYSLASFQGIRVGRKLPSSGSVTLKSPLNVSIPAYTSFESGGYKFFNRVTLSLVANVPLVTTLYQGEVVHTTTAGLGEDYQLFFSQESGFKVSDVDVQVIFNSLKIKRSTVGLWQLKYTPGFVDRTLPDGRMSIQFGTLNYGSRPDANDTLVLTYVVTEGSFSNSYTVLNKAIACDAFSTLTGSFTSNLSGGADEKSAVSYKNISAPSFGNFGSAVTGPQYQSTAREYPGIIDALVFAQRDVNPTSIQWMNLMKVVAVTTTPFSTAQKNAYLQAIQDKSMYSTRFYWEDPIVESAVVDITLFCYNWANLGQVRLNVITAITNFFAVRPGCLGYDYYISDIARVAREADPGLEYFEVNSPTTDIIVSSQAVGAPTLVESVGSGFLPTGTYAYSLAVTSASGTVTTRNWSSLGTTSPLSAINLSWLSIPGATSYTIYGRNPASPGLIATLPATATSFIDTGVVVPGAAPPPQNSSPIKYVVLSSVDATSQYSSRQLR